MVKTKTKNLYTLAILSCDYAFEQISNALSVLSTWMSFPSRLFTFTFKKCDMGGKALRIDLVCQWFILNGISKTFCFGFISLIVVIFLLLSFYTCELLELVRFFRLFSFFFSFCLYLLFWSCGKEDTALPCRSKCFNAPMRWMVSGIRWHMYYRLTWEHVSHSLKKKNHHTFTIYTFWLWFISPFFLFLHLLLCYNFWSTKALSSRFCYFYYKFFFFILLNTFIYFFFTLFIFFL